MKKIIVAAVIIFFNSCKKEKNIDAVTGENTIAEGQCLVNVKGQSMKICFDGLEQDSRCPVNAFCISRGVAVVKLTVTYPGASVTFNLADIKGLSVYANDTTINNVNIKLINVTPWPGESDYDLKKKKATIDIK